jgi:hypothetical protein
LPLLDPLPDLYAQPDLTGSGLGMDWLINGLGENKEMPREGDVVIKGRVLRYGRRRCGVTFATA